MVIFQEANGIIIKSEALKEDYRHKAHELSHQLALAQMTYTPSAEAISAAAAAAGASGAAATDGWARVHTHAASAARLVTGDENFGDNIRDGDDCRAGGWRVQGRGRG